jgi:hypothetical protein
VYVAGVLIPVNSVTISAAYSNIPRCSISVPPHYSLYGISRRDRVPVQVFLGNTFAKAKSGGGNKFSGDPENDFILIFEGEISGFGYVSRASGKEFIINCVHHSIVFNDIKLDFLSSIDELSKAHLPGEYLASLKSFTYSKQFLPLSLFMHGLSFKEGIIKYPTELLANAINFILKKEDAKFTDSSVLSDYYSSRFSLLKMDKRFSSIGIFDESNEVGECCFPLLSGMQKSFTAKFLQAGLNQMSGPNFGSLFEILAFVLEKLEYEFAMYTNPTGTPGGNINFMCLKPMLYEALPPLCNVIFKSHVGSISTVEQTHGVPTRVRVKDLTYIPGITDTNSPLSPFMRLDYYPSEKYTKGSDVIHDYDSGKSLFNSEILRSELSTGPFLYDCMAPGWTTYLNNTDASDPAGFMEYKNRIMKSQLQMKILESRNFNVTMAFNPYVVQGVPAVVYDTEDSSFIFVGYVLAVDHTISKRGISTTLNLGLVRDIKDELNDDTMLNNTYEPISTKYTHKVDQMTKVYNTICNSEAIDYNSLATDYLKHDAQYDPLEAYEVNSRNVCTFKTYMDFMGLTYTNKSSTRNSAGDVVYTMLDGEYVDKRYNSDLRDKILKPIADSDFSTRIYAQQD